MPTNMKRVIIFDFNRTIYDPEAKRLLPNAKQVLRTLRKRGFELYLVSMVETSRNDLIQSLGIKSYFARIMMVQEKRKEDFQDILFKKNIDYTSSFVIGDRVKGEIAIGNMLGLKTIWLKQGKFAKELPQEVYEHPTNVVLKLKDILEIV